MKIIRSLHHQIKRNPLTYRAIGYVTLFSALFAVITSVIQLTFEYQHELNSTQVRFQQIEESYVPSLTQSIWQSDRNNIELQLKGILGFQDIEQVTLINLDDKDFHLGTSIPTDYQIIHTTEIKHPGRVKPMGELVMKANQYNIYMRLKRKGLIILFSHALLTFLLALLISFIFQRLITKHLTQLANQARTFTLKNNAPPIKLEKRGNCHPDEIDRLVFALNDMHSSLLEDNKKRLFAEEVLRRKEEQYRRLIEDLKDEYVFYSRTPRGIFTYVSPSITNVLGYSQEEFLAHYTHFLTDNPQNLINHHHALTISSGEMAPPFEAEIFSKSGDKHLTLVHEHPVFDDTGTVIAVDGLSRDITESTQQKNELIRSETRYAIALEASAAGIFEYQVPINDDIHFSDRWCEIFGYTRNEVPQERNFIHWWYKRIHTKDRPPMKTAYEAFLDGKTKVFDQEIRIRHKSGKARYIHVLARAINRTSEGRTTAVAGAITDISQRKRYEEKLLKQANYDNLTGLPNRALATDRLSQSITLARREKSRVAIMFIDLDHFKHVNDTLGHASGDLLLIDAAKRIKQCIRATSTVSRLGGDEFLIITPNVKQASSCERVAQRILNALTAAFILGEQEVYVAASIGIAVYPNDGEDEHTLLKNADAAMYRAKERGRSTYQFFTEAINQKSLARLTLETELRHAIEHQEFELHYQPIVDIKNNRVTSVEALLRWHHPRQGLVSPDTFIPLAEETGLIVPIGNWVISAACEQLHKWHQCGWKDLTMAINISFRQIRHAKLLELIIEQLKLWQIQPGHIELEVTEGLVLDDSPETKKTLMEIKELGIGLAIDDFGTGYSSLSYLKKYPFNILKIDRTFSQNVTTDEHQAILSKAIIMMAHGLGLKVIGEGVETREQLDFLTLHQCDLIQGFYFSKPLTADDFTSLLHDQKTIVELPT